MQLYVYYKIVMTENVQNHCRLNLLVEYEYTCILRRILLENLASDSKLSVTRHSNLNSLNLTAKTNILSFCLFYLLTCLKNLCIWKQNCFAWFPNFKSTHLFSFVSSRFEFSLLILQTLFSSFVRTVNQNLLVKLEEFKKTKSDRLLI